MISFHLAPEVICGPFTLKSCLVHSGHMQVVQFPKRPEANVAQADTCTGTCAERVHMCVSIISSQGTLTARRRFLCHPQTHPLTDGELSEERE